MTPTDRSLWEGTEHDPLGSSPARASDPSTSSQAGEAAELRATGHKLDTLWLYSTARTDEQAWKASADLEHGQWDKGTLQKRRFRMTEKGRCHPPLITEARDGAGNVIERLTLRGQPATVWILTHYGQATYERWRNER